MNEVVPEHLRGGENQIRSLPDCFSVTTSLGLLDIHAVFLILGYISKDKGIRRRQYVACPSRIQWAWPTLLLLGLYWIPESPRWLVMNDRDEEADVIINRLHFTGKDCNNESARAELYQI